MLVINGKILYKEDKCETCKIVAFKVSDAEAMFEYLGSL
jgi:hypothetical protein